jgi:hypothetical protein
VVGGVAYRALIDRLFGEQEKMREESANTASWLDESSGPLSPRNI